MRTRRTILSAMAILVALALAMAFSCAKSGGSHAGDDDAGDDDAGDDTGGPCVIGGTSYDAGATNPDNPCQACLPEHSATDWSDRPDGATCDDGVYCNGADACAVGACATHAGPPCLICVEGTHECDNPWKPISHGTFSMGSPDDEPGHLAPETQHSVTLTRDFAINETSVTQAQFQAIMGYNPTTFPACGDGCPADTVSWFDALAFAVKASEAASLAPCYDLSDIQCADASSGDTTTWCKDHGGIASATVAFHGSATPYQCDGYRLPTEAEREYATRAGTTTAYYGGASDDGHLACETPFPVLDGIGWYCGNSDNILHPTAQKTPNAWGLYDMAGGVYEWAWDWHGDYTGDATDPTGPEADDGQGRVNRGGSWEIYAEACRSAFRGRNPPGAHYGSLGVRLVRAAP